MAENDHNLAVTIEITFAVALEYQMSGTTTMDRWMDGKEWMNES